jgi:uncharacterized membrane protein
MKKLILIGVIVVVIFAALGVAGFAYAQGQTPSTPASPNSRGSSSQLWMNSGSGSGYMNGRGQGRMGGMRAQTSDGAYGPLHEYLINTMAQALGLTAEQLQARLDAGETMWTIAQEQGISAETFSQLMTQARADSIDQSEASGALTQEQANFMRGRMSNMWPEGYGPGSANCDGTGIQAGRSGAGRVMARGRGMSGQLNGQATP